MLVYHRLCGFDCLCYCVTLVNQTEPFKSQLPAVAANDITS